MQSYRNRYAGHETEIRKDIQLQGLLPSQEIWGSKSLEAFRVYAEKELGIQNPVLVNENYTKSNKQLFRDFIAAMYDTWRENQETIKTLREELEEIHSQETQRDALAKAQLLEMLNAVKVRG